MVRRTAERVFMPLTVGGGIRTLDDAKALIKAGAEKVSLNSAAVRTPELITQISRWFGRCATVVNIDPKWLDRDGERVAEVHINGGRVPTGLEAVAWAQRVEELGAGEIVLTCMDADGTKAGYDLTLTRLVSESVGIPVVASGGAGHPDHLADAILIGKADAALAASIFHFGEFSIAETKHIMQARGVNVRLPLVASAQINNKFRVS
jgi:cyclase